jgi:membrane-associated phospholipid phosphatase
MSCHFFVRHFFLWRVPDYLMIIIMAVIAAIVGAKVRPHCRDFEWTDASINHPLTTKEAFPMYSVVIAVIFIALVYFAGELCTKWSRPAGKMNMCLHINGWVVTHAYSILLAFAFVNVSKLYAGRLRPDFLARLAKEGITEANFATFTHDQICHAARNGRLSFPSGHSGTSFAGFVPPCMYLMGLMRTLNGGRVWLATIAMLPLILPVTVAVSRTVDYRHNFDDILCGSICGALCGVFAVLISFRVSQRGEWTLRDHPGDKAETRAFLLKMLKDDDGQMRTLVPTAEGDGDEDFNDSSNSRSRSRSRSDSEDSEGDDGDVWSREAAVVVPQMSSDHHIHHKGHKFKRHHKQKYQPPTAAKQRDDSAQSFPLSADAVHDGNGISPAAYRERAPNPSPLSRRYDASMYVGEGEQGWAVTSTDRMLAERRRSTGDPSTVEHFY